MRAHPSVSDMEWGTTEYQRKRLCMKPTKRVLCPPDLQEDYGWENVPEFLGGFRVTFCL